MGGKNAFFRAADGRLAVPAGLAQAARQLRDAGVLDGVPWDGGLIYLVTATGGATAGFPDTWVTQERARPDGGVRVTVEMPATLVAHAAAGASGPPTDGGVARGRRGGLAPPPEMATATLHLETDYSLAWTYQLGGREIAGPAAAAAAAPPVLSDRELIAALDGARLRARAPRAMPVDEPVRWAGHPDVVVVNLWRLGPVHVYMGAAASPRERLSALGIDQRTRPAALVARLCAAGALPPGLVPNDLLATARVQSGELVAELPASLVEWAAAGARVPAPRAPGGGTIGARIGRVRLPLDGSLAWRLEVADGATWHATDSLPPSPQK